MRYNGFTVCSCMLERATQDLVSLATGLITLFCSLFLCFNGSGERFGLMQTSLFSGVYILDHLQPDHAPYKCIKVPMLMVSVITRYMLGMLSSVLDEVENAFDGYQFYKASQVKNGR